VQQLLCGSHGNAQATQRGYSLVRRVSFASPFIDPEIEVLKRDLQQRSQPVSTTFTPTLPATRTITPLSLLFVSLSSLPFSTPWQYPYLCECGVRSLFLPHSRVAYMNIVPARPSAPTQNFCVFSVGAPYMRVIQLPLLSMYCDNCYDNVCSSFYAVRTTAHKQAQATQRGYR
jgi:hypothetical protein